MGLSAIRFDDQTRVLPEKIRDELFVSQVEFAVHLGAGDVRPLAHRQEATLQSTTCRSCARIWFWEQRPKARHSTPPVTPGEQAFDRLQVQDTQYLGLCDDLFQLVDGDHPGQIEQSPGNAGAGDTPDGATVRRSQ